ncbi:MAG: rRNA maturation RNase YbeY [Candidatus Cybelea sp.]|jgi:probable rRNA maturation factor
MIHYRNDVRRSGVDGRGLVSTARRLLAAIGESGALSLTLIGDEAMRALNRDYRGKDAPTDVLSFPMDGPGMPPAGERLLGDVVISVDTARRQAADYDAPLQDEIYRLLIHGLLHLLGHDHVLTGERRAMELRERQLAEAIALPWPYAAKA